MALFSSMEAAETRAKAKTADGTWIDAHSARRKDGTIVVRVKRWIAISGVQGGGPFNEALTGDGQTQAGAWAELDDDTAV